MRVTKDGVDMKPELLVGQDGGRVHMDVYRDPAVFAEEMRRIFHKVWIYVGHESEIPSTGDYKTAYLGQVPVIVSRDEDMGVNVLVNRCAHRGTTVCQRASGNASYFKCEYHAWVYNNKGALTGVALRRGYADSELPKGIGLQRVPRVDSYQGLIFASLNPDVESLVDYLGPACSYLDDWARQTPSGRVDLRGGDWKLTYKGNWKLQAENSTEGYHPDFLHQAAVQVQVYNSNRRQVAAGQEGTAKPQRTATLNGLGRDLGRGHNVLEVPQVQLLARRRYPQHFIEELSNAYGEDRLGNVLGPPWRMLIFPNLAIAGSNIRVINPLSVDETDVRQYFVDLPTAPESVRAFRREQEQGFYGPSGYGGPDDVEMFERMQEGFKSATASLLDPWVLFTRQLEDEQEMPDGQRVGGHTSEIMQRAVYRGWVRQMTEGA